MALVLVRAEQTVHVHDLHGKLITYYKGDWFKIGKMRAREMILSRQVSIPGTEEARTAVIGPMDDAGVLVRNGHENNAAHILDKYAKMSVGTGTIELLWDRTLLWKPYFPMKAERCAMGMARIERGSQYARWEVAAMLRGHDLLASGFGPKEDQEGTLEAIGDLRVPLYESAAVWVRKTRATEKMVAAWKEELDRGVSDEHAFVRAIYANRVVLCTLPSGWLAQWVGV